MSSITIETFSRPQEPASLSMFKCVHLRAAPAQAAGAEYVLPVGLVLALPGRPEPQRADAVEQVRPGGLYVPELGPLSLGGIANPVSVSEDCSSLSWPRS